MQIAIISDVHNNEVNLKKVLDYCAENKIKKIICCGDLASMETLDFLNDNFKGEIYFTFGNMDNDFLKNYPFEELDSSASLGMTWVYKKTKIFKEFGEAEIEILGTKSPIGDLVPKIKVAFVHFPRIAKSLCETGKYEFVFYGHTHKPWEEIVNDCKMLNPGNVAGEIFLPTFALWDTTNDRFELIRVHNLK